MLGGVLSSAVWAQEQDEPDTVIQEIRTSYRELEYEQAEQTAREMLSEYQQLTIDQLVEVHRLLGLIEISQNDRAAARRHFEAALSLNPNLTLDPTLVSPKIIDFFREVRRSYLAEAARSVSDSVAVHYRLIPDPRPEAALRSALLPGWGQLYKGEAGKGRILMGIWGVSAGGAVLAHILGRAAENPQENNLEFLGEEATSAEWWKDARNGFLVTAAGTWLFSYLDALLTRTTPSGQAQMRLVPDAHMRPRVMLQVRF